MIRTFPLILLAVFSFTTSAQTILPQTESNGEDGLFSIDIDTTLFSDADNIYNFTDFIISNNATLNIFSDSAIYLYSQQSITIDGGLFADTPELHLIAPLITGLNATINTTGSLNLYSTTTAGEPAPITGDGSGVVIIGGDTGTISLGDSIILDNTVTINPVPVPAALWLLISGLISMALIRRKSVA